MAERLSLDLRLGKCRERRSMDVLQRKKDRQEMLRGCLSMLTEPRHRVLGRGLKDGGVLHVCSRPLYYTLETGSIWVRHLLVLKTVAADKLML